MKLVSAAGPLGIALVLSFASPTSASTLTNFTGAYAVGNWTTVGACGSVDTSGAPTSIELTSCDNQSNTAQNIDFVYPAFETATISFDWDWQSFDEECPPFGDCGSQDPFGYVLNGVFTRLVADAPTIQSGSISFGVSPGDIFGFRARSADSLFGPAVTTVSNFQVDTVPEPTTLLLLGVGLAASAARRRTAARRS